MIELNVNEMADDYFKHIRCACGKMQPAKVDPVEGTRKITKDGEPTRNNGLIRTVSVREDTICRICKHREVRQCSFAVPIMSMVNFGDK